jgi:hypothetical protein
VQNLLKPVFWLALVFACVMAILPNAPDLPGPFSDKIQHMTAFGTLTVLGMLAYPRIPRILIAFGLVILGALIEIVQMLPVLHRDSEWGDLLADSIAIVVAFAFIQIVLKARPKP